MNTSQIIRNSIRLYFEPITKAYDFLRHTEIFMPWKNLGCLGLRLSPTWYADMHWKPAWQLYVNDGVFRRWYSLPRFLLLKVQVIDPENARRVFRRTMKPYAALPDHTGRVWEAISYPYLTDLSEVAIMIRNFDEPDTMHEYPCRLLRPIQFWPRRTGVPANDPT